MRPKVSVIIPIYNGEKYLAESLDSILNQSYLGDIEVICVNDGSTDESIAILKNYSESYSNILVLEKSNSGIVDTLNMAIDAATGDYWVRMDQDDISLPKRIKRQVDFMELNPDIDICGSAMEVFLPDGKSYKVSYPENNSSIKEMMFYASPFSHPTIIIRSKTMRDHCPLYDKKFNNLEDYALFLKSSLHDVKFHNIKDVLLKYRIAINVTSKENANELKRVACFSELVSTYFYDIYGVSLSNSMLENFIYLTKLEIVTNKVLSDQELNELFCKMSSYDRAMSSYLIVRYIISKRQLKIRMLSKHTFYFFRYIMRSK